MNRMDPYLEFAGTSIMERSFAELEYENKKTTRRELFPEGIEEQIPWHGLVEQIRPYYSVSNSSTTSVIRPWSTCSMRLRACVALTGIRLENADYQKGAYDGQTVKRKEIHRGVHSPETIHDYPVLSQMITIGINKALPSGNGHLTELYPCLMKCLSGGGNHPTVDKKTITNRKNWLELLWEGK